MRCDGCDCKFQELYTGQARVKCDENVFYLCGRCKVHAEIRIEQEEELKEEMERKLRQLQFRSRFGTPS